MPKRKFAIRSLFAGRAGRSGKDHEVEAWASDSDDYNDAHPFDPSEVNRPPKLDARTENDLRRACAIIVENLKPSGHDLEDTRMQSDILVANPELLSNRSSLPVKRAGIPQAGATWYQEGSTRSSQLVYPNNVVKSSDNRDSSYSVSGPPPEYDSLDNRSSRTLQGPNVMVSRPIERTESPLAPMATEAVQSRDLASPVPKQVAETRAESAARHDSSSSMSNYATSDNGLRASSTGATSANYTPSPTSKRESDVVRHEPNRTASVAAAAGAWKRQEMERRRLAEEMNAKGRPQSQALLGNYFAGTDPRSGSTQDDSNSGEARDSMSPSMTSSETTVQGESRAVDATDAPSGTLSGPFEQPSFVGTEAAGAGGADSLTTPSSATANTQNVRGVSFQDRGKVTSEPQKTASGEETGASKLAETYRNSLGQQESVAADEKENQPSEKTSRRSSKRLSKDWKFKAPGQTSTDNSKSGSRALSPTSATSPTLPIPKPPQSWPAPPKPRYSGANFIPEIPPLPNKHQFDDSIVVKDFYQPSSVPRGSALPTSRNPDRRPARPGDVEAADFDSFMSVVEERGEENDTAVTRLDSPSPEVGSPQIASAVSQPRTPNGDVTDEPQTLTTDVQPSNGEVSPLESPSFPPAQDNATTSALPNGDSETKLQAQSPLMQSTAAPQQPNSRPRSEPSPILPPPPPEPQPPVQREQRQAPLPAPVVSPGLTSETRSPVVVTSSRASISASIGPTVPSHSRSQSLNRKSPGGLKRILSRLGNGDKAAPAYATNSYSLAKRKVFQRYAPGAYVPGHGLNGGVEEDEDLFDEQACAAPVVGFGRGW